MATARDHLVNAELHLLALERGEYPDRALLARLHIDLARGLIEVERLELMTQLDDEFAERLITDLPLPTNDEGPAAPTAEPSTSPERN